MKFDELRAALFDGKAIFDQVECVERVQRLLQQQRFEIAAALEPGRLASTVIHSAGPRALDISEAQVLREYIAQVDELRRKLAMVDAGLLKRPKEKRS